MSDSKLPTEVELVYEVMPCNAMRSFLEPFPENHVCRYFNKWGTYHSFDYILDGPQPKPGVPVDVKYVGRARLVPEIMSGCRKVPLMAVGINPNLPGWYAAKRDALNPLFDDYKQYAHYFRYRSTYKLRLGRQSYQAYGGGPHDTADSNFELNVPADTHGDKIVKAIIDEQTMYKGYQGLLNDLAVKMNWDGAELALAEDFGYMNMVACPSARWTTNPIANDPNLPPMTVGERDGIVHECFNERRYFFRQLFQSFPNVLIVFSQSTANAFIAEMQGNFTKGDPKRNERINDLLQRDVRLAYGRLSDGTMLDARVIFSPHISGNPDEFGLARDKVLAHLVDEAQRGGLAFNQQTGHLVRSKGACAFCPMLQIGPCPYESELTSITTTPWVAADFQQPAAVLEEKRMQIDLLGQFMRPPHADKSDWTDSVDDNILH